MHLKTGFDYSYSYYASGAALWHSPAIWQNSKNIAAPGYLTHNLTDETLKLLMTQGKTVFHQPGLQRATYSIRASITREIYGSV